ncbi:MAG: 6-bladed beta-propeller, partial [Bacteroidaceae bacterium]|nr:6-bladed beta-propeller [Bacteroidaceae bacterium]
MQEWMYDYQTGKTFQPIFKNQDAPSMKLDAHTLIHCHGEDNCLYVKLEAFELIEALENGELNGELQTIAQELVEDDNPVLMIVKL